MKKFTTLFSLYAAVGLMLFGLAGQADAQRRNDREVRDIVRSLNSKVDDFKYNLDYQMRSSSVDEQEAGDVSGDLGDLQDKIQEFDKNFAAKRENRSDVSDIIASAKQIDSFLTNSRQNNKLQSDWTSIRTLIERLGNSYNVSPDWGKDTADYPVNNNNRNNYPTTSSAPGIFNNVLTGTYKLDTARSENTADIVSGTNVGTGQKQELESKLESPEQLALDIRGDQVTLASSKAAPVTFTADGREKTEQSGGRTVRIRATLRGQELTVSSLGGETDYTVTFLVSDGGRSLKVTRRITTDYLRETIFADSFYNKTDAVAQLGIDNSNTAGSSDNNGTYSSNDPNDGNGNYGGAPSMNLPRIGEFAVQNGTVVTAILENQVTSKVSQNNDRFKLTVQSPDEYRGAVIEGYISGVGRSGQVSGRSNITFNFERITLRDGKAYDFAGSLSGVKDTSGKDVKIDTEGTAKGDSQTKETVKRGGIGAGIGALIGAIAGGGKGAAIGAIIGGGAGAGSVAIQGRDDLELEKGSTMTIIASSPNR